MPLFQSRAQPELCHPEFAPFVENAFALEQEVLPEHPSISCLAFGFLKAAWRLWFLYQLLGFPMRRLGVPRRPRSGGARLGL